MQKRPNPTFLKKAESIRHSRTRRNLVIILSVLVVTLAIVFVTSVAAAQDRYRAAYPWLVGAATSTTTTWSEYTRPVHNTETETTPETTTETTTEATTTAPRPIIATTASSGETAESTAATSQNNSPDIYSEPDPVHFNASYPSRICSYQQRAVAMDQLKEKISQYQTDNPGYRICYDMVFLTDNTSIGSEELAPILPSGAWALPEGILLSESIRDGKLSVSDITTYDGSGSPGLSSYIADNFVSGKQLYTRMLMHYALSLNDSLALGYINGFLGGTEAVAEAAAQISGYSSYVNKYIYTDFRGMEISSTGLSTCYDMVNYLRTLYKGFVNDPDCYQSMMNDLATSEVSSPIAQAFGESAKVYHILGRNTMMGAYVDCAIVDGSEPVLLVIYCEAQTPESAGNAIYTIAGYTQEFIASCY